MLSLCKTWIDVLKFSIHVPHKWILNFSTSIQVLHNKSIGMTSAGSPWLRYVGNIEWSSTKIPWKVDYLVTAGVLKMKMCLISGYWISVHRFKSCTMKASVWLQLVRFDFGMLDILNESGTKIPLKVDYLFTAGVLKMKMCLISGYWISVHRFKSCNPDAFIVQDLNRCTEFQYTLLGHFLYFSTTAVKR